jgi:NADPH-dependent 2,4-dienoyl-CoA reductase/sulfur reductase-like enzyme
LNKITGVMVSAPGWPHQHAAAPRPAQINLVRPAGGGVRAVVAGGTGAVPTLAVGDLTVRRTGSWCVPDRGTWAVGSRERLVVVGGDAAGMSAASQARRRRAADELEIVVFERGNFTSYSACGIAYLVGDVVPDAGRLIARHPGTFRSRFDVEVHLRQEVTEVDLGRRAVRVRDLHGAGERWERFDQLMVATGAVPARPRLPGADAAGICGVQVLDDGLAIRRILDDQRPRRAVVVGGGYIGLEMAEALVMRRLDVALVDAAPQPMKTLDEDMGALVADALRRVGVTLYLGERVTGFETSAGRVRAVATANRVLPADLVILGLGVRPNTTLALSAGIAVGPTGGIITDRRMRAGTAGGVGRG